MVVGINLFEKWIALARRGRRTVLVGTFLLCSLVLLFVSFVGPTVFTCQAMGSQVDQAGRAIDVFCNKEPFSGKGQNQPSDAYEPQEEVVLYGLVTYNSDPVPGKIVTFDVHGPVNPIENVTLSLSDVTNDSGLAHVSFVMPWPDPRPKATLFGVWTVVASVDIAGVVVSDALSFNVGWIVELLYVKTVDLNNTLRSTFAKGERMAFRLGVRNIAMTEKVATFVVSASDELNVAVGLIRLDDEVVPPGEREYFVKEMVVPMTAFIGEGKAVANAFKSLHGEVSVPWCPSVETTFEIGLLHDVAVLGVVSSVREAFAGQPVNITVLVKNKGQADESFNTNAYYNSTLIGTVRVYSLAPNGERTLHFVWVTWGVAPGDYVMRAQAGPVLGETNLGYNVFVDGSVKIKTLPGPPSLCPDSRWLLALVFVLIVLIAALLVAVVILFLFGRRRRKRGEDESETGLGTVAVLPSAGVKRCRVCGKEFPSAYTFCPHCMSFHGKDFEK